MNISRRFPWILVSLVAGLALVALVQGAVSAQGPGWPPVGSIYARLEGPSQGVSRAVFTGTVAGTCGDPENWYVFGMFSVDSPGQIVRSEGCTIVAGDVCVGSTDAERNFSTIISVTVEMTHSGLVTTFLQAHLRPRGIGTVYIAHDQLTTDWSEPPVVSMTVGINPLTSTVGSIFTSTVTNLGSSPLNVTGDYVEKGGESFGILDPGESASLSWDTGLPAGEYEFWARGVAPDGRVVTATAPFWVVTPFRIHLPIVLRCYPSSSVLRFAPELRDGIYMCGRPGQGIGGSVEIHNDGCSQLIWRIVDSDGMVGPIGDMVGNVPPGGEGHFNFYVNLLLRHDGTPVAEGDYPGHITFSSNDPARRLFDIPTLVRVDEGCR